MMQLTEIEIAEYVDALVTDKQDQLPEDILEHVEECVLCKVEIIEMWKLIDAFGPHPMLGSAIIWIKM